MSRSQSCVKRYGQIAILAIVLGCSKDDREVPLTNALSALTSVESCAGGQGMLDGRGVGSLRLGMSVDSALAVCPSANDTVASEEGQRARVLVAVIDGDTVRVRIVENTVHSIMVESPLFATADSLKAGVSIARLLSVPELTGGFGEGEFYVWSGHERWCGLSFRLDAATARALTGTGTFTRFTLAPYADSGRVSAILVRGCEH